MGRQQMLEWKEDEARDARGNGAHQKDRSPAVKPFGGQQSPPDHDES